MRMRIFINLILLTCFPVISLMAQDDILDHLTVPFSNPEQSGHIEISLLKGAVTVTGYQGTEVDITSRLRSMETSKHERSRESSRERSRSTGSNSTEGMFRIPVSSSELEVEEYNNHMEINMQSMRKAIDLDIKVPLNTSIEVNAVHDGNIKITNVNGEIEAENVHGSITITEVSGSVAASTTHGNVKVALKDVDPRKPMSFNTFHGNVDVTLPATLKANVKIKTTNGDVYSDFSIVKTENPERLQKSKKGKDGKYKIKIEHGFYGTIAGGGPEYTFSTYHGDILIRKIK